MNYYVNLKLILLKCENVVIIAHILCSYLTTVKNSKHLCLLILSCETCRYYVLRKYKQFIVGTIADLYTIAITSLPIKQVPTLYDSTFVQFVVINIRCMVFKTYLNFSVAWSKNSDSQQYIITRQAIYLPYIADPVLFVHK